MLLFIVTDIVSEYEYGIPYVTWKKYDPNISMKKHLLLCKVSFDKKKYMHATTYDKIIKYFKQFNLIYAFQGAIYITKNSKIVHICFT